MELGQTRRKGCTGSENSILKSLTRFQVESEYMDVELAAMSGLRGERVRVRVRVIVVPRGSGS